MVHPLIRKAKKALGLHHRPKRHHARRSTRALFESRVQREKAEHPWASDKTARRIVRDHSRMHKR